MKFTGKAARAIEKEEREALMGELVWQRFFDHDCSNQHWFSGGWWYCSCNCHDPILGE